MCEYYACVVCVYKGLFVVVLKFEMKYDENIELGSYTATIID